GGGPVMPNRAVKDSEIPLGRYDSESIGMGDLAKGERRLRRFADLQSASVSQVVVIKGTCKGQIAYCGRGTGIDQNEQPDVIAVQIRILRAVTDQGDIVADVDFMLPGNRVSRQIGSARDSDRAAGCNRLHRRRR